MVGSNRALCFAWVVGLITSPALLGRAQAPTPAHQRHPAASQQGASSSQGDAAAQFDAAIVAYKAADYARAAELFLVADGLSPSVTALSNALAAARRTQQPLLMARVAQRALARSELGDADKRSARSMLEQAEPKLSRLELRCANEPCSVLLDGVAVAPGTHYLEPGTHRVREASGAEIEAHCAAGQVCPVTLPAQPPRTPAPAQAASAPLEAASAPLEPAAASAPAAEPVPLPSPRWKRRLPLGVLIGAGAGALVFGGLSIWQGVAALDEKERYEDGESGDWDEVRARARRSDAFMITGIALAGVAAATAIWWVDWDAQSRSQLALLPEGGATLTMWRRF